MKNINQKITEAITVLEKLKDVSPEILDDVFRGREKLHDATRFAKLAEKGLELHGKKAKFSNDSPYIYAGCTLPILGIYIIESGSEGVYEKGSMHLRLGLRDTPFEWKEDREGKPVRTRETVMHTDKFEIID